MALSWTASTDSGCTVSVIDHYNLYKATYAITASTDLRTITPISVAGNNATYTDSTGTPNTTYWYVLTAVDPSGNESAKSNIITMTTAADTMAPAAITDLKASPTAGQVQLTWCKPSDNVGVNHYDIYRKEQGTILTDADTVTANKIATFTNAGTCLSYNDTPLTSGHTYSYAVISVDGAGNRATISRGQATGDTIATLP
jgi:fibronectin type 3 domain-containing protein